MPSVTGGNAETVHRDNLAAVIRRVHWNGATSRTRLVLDTGLSRSAVRSLVAELAALGLVYETRATGRSRGRPSPLVHPKSEGAVVIAMDVEVDSLAVATVGLGGHVFREIRVDRARVSAPPEETANELAALAQRVLPRAGLDAIVGVGISVAGIVRHPDGLVHFAPNLGWHDVALADLVGERLGVGVPVRVGNEADLGALAEHVRGSGVGVDDLLFVSGEVGIGGGVIVGGRALTGSVGYGGEIGHMMVNPIGMPCRCGSIGCWETEIGEEAILRYAGVRDGRGGPEAIELVLRRMSDGDERALLALNRVAHWLAVGVASLANVLNPQLVILGGLLARLHPFIGASVEAEVARLALPIGAQRLRIVRSSLGPNACVIGAAEMAFAPGLADPALLVTPPAVPHPLVRTSPE